MPYSSNRSPQSEGDTSSSMDSPAHTPDRGQRAFRRKRQQNTKRRHRVVVDLEVKDGHIVSSTDSSFDVATIPPPLLTEGQSLDVEDDENDEMSETKDDRRQQQHWHGADDRRWTVIPEEETKNWALVRAQTSRIC